MTAPRDLERIGFVGLGQMGSRMARRLLDAGHQVCAYDLDAAAVEALAGHGATPAGSLADLAAASDVVLLSLPTPQVAREVVLGPSGLLAAGGFDCLIDHSTTGLEVAREIAAGAAASGVEMVDAPVSGGVRGAEQGTLAIMVSAPDDVVARRRHVLEAVGSRIFHVGAEPGQGQVIKLVNNLISAAAMVATAEGMVLGVKAGLDPAVMLDVLNASTARNSHTEDKFPRYVLPRTFDFGFTIGLLHKDVRLALQMAESLEVPTLVTGNAHQVWSVALAEGGPDKDMTTIVQHLERWTGVRL
jgi:3-hydroxyisobutyrate dehydrogenase-like beta-hydroxyacid dehydrogenase